MEAEQKSFEDQQLVAIEPNGTPSANRLSFSQRLNQDGIIVNRTSIETLQLNLGKLCNQACHHCHVDASPTRTEIMTRETVDLILGFLANSDIPVVDITGGAPEINPSFRHLTERIRSLGRGVMVRCNLTVLLEDGQEDLAEFYRDNQVELVCSLPCYLEDNVDSQRGKGVFTKSIDALLRLNAIGYGQPDTGLLLHLVYNPIGATLPPPQAELESDYKHALEDTYGIVFNQLYTITNMPISRFNEYLIRRGEYDVYTRILQESFNPSTIGQLMCRSLISVDWEGNMFDCDFNQMLDMELDKAGTKIWEVSPEWLLGRRVRVADHCYGCTAGAGSSCGGELV
jgi:radical SAM/Cys-rich protein